MSVPSVNIRIEKGTTFETTFTVTNSDGSVYSLNNYTATSKIRKHPTASSSKSFSSTITSSTGEIKISMSAANTADLSSGRNYFDVIITKTSDGSVTKVIEGMALVVDTVSL
jgi:hypothetical protein